MNNFTGGLAISTPLKIFVRNRSSSMAHKVFVYGTLKTNEPNNRWLTDESKGVSRFVNIGTTKRKYPLIIATKYNIPFLLYSPGVGHHVKGEIYEVDDQMLTQLDILEDHPNYYIREIDDIEAKNKDSETVEIHKCWVYFLKKFKPDLLNRQLFEVYSSNGPHGLRYMDRSKRDPSYDYKTEIRGVTEFAV